MTTTVLVAGAVVLAGVGVIVLNVREELANRRTGRWGAADDEQRREAGARLSRVSEPEDRPERRRGERRQQHPGR